MRTTRIGFTFISLLVLSLISFFLRAESTQSSLKISDAWIRAAPPNAMALAGYITIENDTPQQRQLLAVKSKTFKSIELHRTEIVDGMARMLPQQSMPIPSAGRLVLEPGSFHLMMMHPQKSLREGDEVTASLEFDKHESKTVTFVVKKADGEGHEHHHHHHH